MSTKYLLDPELYPLLDFPVADVSADTLVDLRELVANNAVLADADEAGIERQEIFVPIEGDEDVRCLLYTPQQNASALRPGYVHFHGGGFVSGLADAADAKNIALSANLGVVIMSVDYRLAPEYSARYQLKDGYAALAWLHDNADSHQVDRSRIAVGGESAGGGLAAALAIRAAERAEYSVCHQHLTYPMLDNLTGTAEHFGDPLLGEFIWTRQSNAFGWSSYLGDGDAVAPYVPARQQDFTGLPSTWIAVGSIDLFRDESIRYAQQLLSAGVSTELIIYPGGCHGFPLLPGTVLEKRYTRDHQETLARALGVL